MRKIMRKGELPSQSDGMQPLRDAAPVYKAAVRDLMADPQIRREHVPEHLRGEWEATHLPAGVSTEFSSAVARRQRAGLPPDWNMIDMTDEQLRESGPLDVDLDK